MPEKKLLEITVDEKDGEYVVRLRGENAAEIIKRLSACCCGRAAGADDKAAAGC